MFSKYAVSDPSHATITLLELLQLSQEDAALGCDPRAW